MKKVTSVMLALATLGVVGSAHAQARSPLSVEIRGGLPFPVGDFQNAQGGLQTGYSLGASAMFQLTPMVGLYGGYSTNRFEVENTENREVNDAGFHGGLMASFPMTTGLNPFVKGGVVYHETETVVNGEGQANTDAELGFQAGAGVEIPLGPTLSFTPAVSYTRHAVEGQGILNTPDDNVSYVTADVGLRIRF